MNTLEDRILEIELECIRLGVVYSVPGTTLTRVLKPVSGYEWGLSIGPLNEPRVQFRGATIQLVVVAAEAWLLMLAKTKTKTRKNER